MILFMIPHAGGSAKTYCSFKRNLPDTIRIVPMEVAGRTSRAEDPFCTSIQECAADLLKRHKDDIANEKYALFGHSMGTMIAAELVSQIKEQGLPEPEHVFLSGRFAVDELYNIIPVKDPTDEQIVDFFVEHHMLPDAVTQNADILAMFSRILCADVRMTDGYQISADKAKFNCDISIMYGEDDELLNYSDMSGWKRFAGKGCTFHAFPGGHFYHMDDKAAFCKVIADAIG